MAVRYALSTVGPLFLRSQRAFRSGTRPPWFAGKSRGRAGDVPLTCINIGVSLGCHAQWPLLKPSGRAEAVAGGTIATLRFPASLAALACWVGIILGGKLGRKSGGVLVAQSSTIDRHNGSQYHEAI